MYGWLRFIIYHQYRVYTYGWKVHWRESVRLYTLEHVAIIKPRCLLWPRESTTSPGQNDFTYIWLWTFYLEFFCFTESDVLCIPFSSFLHWSQPEIFTFTLSWKRKKVPHISYHRIISQCKNDFWMENERKMFCMGVKVELFSNQDCFESFPKCIKIALISLLYTQFLMRNGPSARLLS